MPRFIVVVVSICLVFGLASPDAAVAEKNRNRSFIERAIDFDSKFREFISNAFGRHRKIKKSAIAKEIPQNSPTENDASYTTLSKANQSQETEKTAPQSTSKNSETINFQTKYPTRHKKL